MPAVAGVALIALALLAVLLLRGDGARSAGPVVAVEANELSSTVPAWRKFMYGIPVVYNEGDEPATLERATFVRPTPGLEIVRTYVAGPDRGANLISGSRQWPPPRDYELRDLHPLKGYRLFPTGDPRGKRGVELIFVLRARRPRRYITRGVQLDYRVGDKEHRRVIPNGYAACALPRGRNLLRRFCKPPPAALGEL